MGKVTSHSCREISIPEGCLRKKIDIVEKWSKEHPVKTMAMDFFEKFLNAIHSNEAKCPMVCLRVLGYTNETECPDGMTCQDCWNRPLKEE